MSERNKRIESMAEVDMGRFLWAMWNRAWLIVTVGLLCAALTFAGTLFFVTPKYTATAMIYVNNSKISGSNALAQLSSDAISSARSIVDTYIVILYSRETLSEIMEYAGIDETIDEFKDRMNIENMEGISAERVNETEIFRVSVESSDPAEAERLATAVAVVLPQRISDIMNGARAKIVDGAVLPAGPSSPNIIYNAFLGGLIGVFAVIGYVVKKELFDMTIRSETELEKYPGIAILSRIPDLEEEED